MRYLLLVILLILAFLPACLSSSPSASNKLKVITTTGMIADIASQIAGDRAAVQPLMGQGVDPHLYKASPGDVRLMQDADLILFNGLHLEGRLADVLVKLAARKPTVQVTATIPESRLRQPAEFQGHFDPHVWFDIQLWSLAAQRTRDALIERDPAGKAEFQQRADDYLNRLDELDAWTRTQIASIPKERRVLVTAHDAFGYFGQAYDIEVLAIQGISTDSEASIKDMNRLVDLLVARKVPAVFVESSVPHKTIEALVQACQARNHTITVGGELFSDAMGAPNTPEGTYIGMVTHNVTTIVEALKK